MKKILIVTLALIIFLFVGAVLAKDILLKGILEQSVTGITGFKTKIRGLKYDFPATLLIRDLEIRNPAGFKEPVFTRIPEIYVALVLPELLQGKQVHLKEVRLHLQEVHIEKNAEGVSNVELLSSVGAQQQKAAKKVEPKPTMPFWLERLELTIRKVSYEDRSGLLGASPVPSRMAYDMNVEKQVFADIRDPNTLVNLILVKIIEGATLGRLLNLNPEKLLGENFSQVLNSGRAFAERQAQALSGQLTTVGGQIAPQKISGFFGKLKSLQPGEETAKETQ